MTRDEFKTIVMSLKAVYTDPNFIPDQDAFEIWYSLLSDLDYRCAMAAAKKHILSCRFAPAISEIREKYAEIQIGDEMTGDEAWALVARAIRNGIYGYQKEFDALPPLVQKTLGAAGQLHYMAMDTNFNEGVAKSNFLRSYAATLSREKERALMTPDVLRLMERTESLMIDESTI